MTTLSRRTLAVLVPAAAMGTLLLTHSAMAQSLSSFAILAGSTITNTNVSLVNGNIGLYPVITAPAGITSSGANRIEQTGTGVLHINDEVALRAKTDLTTAYNVLMGRPTDEDFTGRTLGTGGLNPLPLLVGGGVYNFDTSVDLVGELTLQGGPDDVFIFKIGSTLTTAVASSITLDGVDGSNVFFVVGSSATLNGETDFTGQILALQSISLLNKATIDCGAAWARNAAVTMDENTINKCTFTVAPGTLGDALGGTATEDELAVRDALNDYVENGGTLPLSYEVLALLTPDELARAFAEMGGEIGGGSSPAAIQAMDSYLDVIFGRLAGSSPGTVMVAREGTPSGMPGDGNTVSVMGYAGETTPAPGSALASLGDMPTGAMPQISEWTIWSSAYGALSATAGDTTSGALGTTTQDYGVAIGFDRHVSADTLLGFSLAIGATGFAVDEDLGTGSSAMVQGAIYGRQSIGDAYVSGVASYARHQNTTDRSVTIGGIDQYHAEFASHDIAAGIEAGYDLGWFTPYGALRGQMVATPAYSETTVSGTETFALAYEERVALAARTEIGARFDWSTAIDRGTFTATSSIAWAHDLSGVDPVTASFQALGDGSSFAVNGAQPAGDSILLAAGIGVQLDSGLGISGALNAALSSNSSTYGASVNIGYSW